MNLIHLTVAATIFVILSLMIFKSYTNYVRIYDETKEAVEIKVRLYQALQKILLPGYPENWHQLNLEQLGLTERAYKKAVIITEANGTDRGKIVVNVSITFDEECDLIALNNTVRVYEEESEVPFKLYNQVFCQDNHIKQADVAIKSSFSANQQRLFFIYFSNDSNILPPNYSVEFNAPENFTVKIFPTEEFFWLSVAKLQALRQIPYNESRLSLLSGEEFYLEIKE